MLAFSSFFAPSIGLTQGPAYNYTLHGTPVQRPMTFTLPPSAGSAGQQQAMMMPQQSSRPMARTPFQPVPGGGAPVHSSNFTQNRPMMSGPPQSELNRPMRPVSYFQESGAAQIDPSHVTETHSYMPSALGEILSDCGPDFCCPPAQCGEIYDPCCCEDGCFADHMHSIFGDYTLLSPGNADLPYAEPVDGATAAAVPIGPIAALRPNHSSNFRAGGSFALSKKASLAVTFANYENDSDHAIDLAGGAGFLRSLATHPQTVNVAADSLSANGSYGIDYRTIDADFRGLVSGGCSHAVNASAGIRFATMDQVSSLNYLINGATNVATNIGFDGIGPRFGLDGEKGLGGSGFLVYGKSAASFLVGEFTGSYRQTNAFNGVEADSGFSDTRIVNVLELESGIAWQTSGRRFRVSSGYQVGGWFNTMNTSSFINSVRNHSFDTSDETMTFDGFVCRAEFRF